MNILEERVRRFNEIDLYPVISSEFTNNRPVLDILMAVADGGAKIVQLREKNKSKREIYKLAEAYRDITAKYDMLFMMNDHVDIALAAGADGVHLGQDDLPVEAARRIAPELLIGNSTHNIEEALAAAQAGAGCINIGPIFTTATKNVQCGALGLDTLKSIASHVNMPFSVMGGIKEHHIRQLLNCGACRIAMVTEITMAEDVCAKVRQLRAYWADPVL
ncbi:MAG: thiamine phosphate synthase [Victivallales bacterium]|nr:thiamine phosphate synthase [Victivallales bacterium]